MESGIYQGNDHTRDHLQLVKPPNAKEGALRNSFGVATGSATMMARHNLKNCQSARLLLNDAFEGGRDTR